MYAHAIHSQLYLPPSRVCFSVLVYLIPTCSISSSPSSNCPPRAAAASNPQAKLETSGLNSGQPHRTSSVVHNGHSPPTHPRDPSHITPSKAPPRRQHTQRPLLTALASALPHTTARHHPHTTHPEPCHPHRRQTSSRSHWIHAPAPPPRPIISFSSIPAPAPVPWRDDVCITSTTL